MRRRGTAGSPNTVAAAVAETQGRHSLPARLLNVPSVLGAALRGDPSAVSRWRLLAMGLGALYVLSPLDFIPEAFLGPLGLADDSVVSVTLVVFLLGASDAYMTAREQRSGSVRSPTARAGM